MVRIGVVGAGRLGTFHAQTLADHTAVTEVVVTDALIERAEAVAADVGGSVAPNAQSMLGSIDALLTSVIAENLTRKEHSSNKELFGQGMGNLTSGLFGGIPGAGATMGTVVNIQTGGRSALSGAMWSGLIGLVVGGIFGGYPDAEPGDRPWNRVALFNAKMRVKAKKAIKKAIKPNIPPTTALVILLSPGSSLRSCNQMPMRNPSSAAISSVITTMMYTAQIGN